MFRPNSHGTCLIKGLVLPAGDPPDTLRVTDKVENRVPRKKELTSNRQVEGLGEAHLSSL